MDENPSWLAAAFSIAWGIIFLYLAWISRKESELRRRVAALEELLKDQ